MAGRTPAGSLPRGAPAPRPAEPPLGGAGKRCTPQPDPSKLVTCPTPRPRGGVSCGRMQMSALWGRTGRPAGAGVSTCVSPPRARRSTCGTQIGTAPPPPPPPPDPSRAERAASPLPLLRRRVPPRCAGRAGRPPPEPPTGPHPAAVHAEARPERAAAVHGAAPRRSGSPRSCALPGVPGADLSAGWRRRGPELSRDFLRGHSGVPTLRLSAAEGWGLPCRAPWPTAHGTGNSFWGQGS